MPFDGRNFGKPDRTPFDDFITSQASHRFDVGRFDVGRFEVDSTRPTTQNSPLFGMDGAEWRGFFFALTGMLALILGLSAVLVATLGH